MTLLPEQARRERIDAALKAHDPNQAESVNVPWKGDTVLCPVVSVPLDAAGLNPHSHRIKSDLESHPHAAEIEADPYSEESQGRIAEILKETDGYGDLRDNIAAEGQRDYGVITNAGLLVNANTRAVALRDVGTDYVKVAVLPGDATEKEIADLEVKLQMQRDFKQDYTFTNELLFVQDLIDRYVYSTERVAKILRRTEKEVEQFVRLLALIRHIQARSNRRIPLKFFDEKEQLLKDLDQSYEAMKDRDSEAASRLRDARVLALLVGTVYRDARQADESFVEDYLIPALQENEELGESLVQVTEGVGTETREPNEVLPGVDELGGEEPGDEAGPDAGALVELVAQGFGEESVRVPNGDGTETEVGYERLVEALESAISEGAGESKADARREKGLSGPIGLLKDARKKLRKVLPAYRDVAGDPDFDTGAFAYEARKLKSDVEALHAEIAKHSEE